MITESTKNIILTKIACGLQLNAEEVEIVAEALEKQILKQTVFKDDDHGGRVRCPTCNATMKYYDEGRHHCPDCGQRLDWSEKT